MPEQSLEERVANLEAEVTALKLAKQAQEDRDIALLARIDNFIDDLRRVERTQLRAFDAQAVQLNGLDRRMDTVETNVATLIDAAKDHKQAIESLAAGQQQILEILIGKPPRND